MLHGLVNYVGFGCIVTTLAAVQDACTTLNARLNQVRQTMSNPTWQELVAQCYNTGVDLSAKAWVMQAQYCAHFFEGLVGWSECGERAVSVQLVRHGGQRG